MILLHHVARRNPKRPILTRRQRIRHAHILPANLLRETWGVEPGSVTPFGAINDTNARVMVVLDAAMMEHDTLNFHPLLNTMTTSIARDDLVRFLEATGHKPRIERISGAAAEVLEGRLHSPSK